MHSFQSDRSDLWWCAMQKVGDKTATADRVQFVATLRPSENGEKPARRKVALRIRADTARTALSKRAPRTDHRLTQAKLSPDGSRA